MVFYLNWLLLALIWSSKMSIASSHRYSLKLAVVAMSLIMACSSWVAAFGKASLCTSRRMAFAPSAVHRPRTLQGNNVWRLLVTNDINPESSSSSTEEMNAPYDPVPYNPIAAKPQPQPRRTFSTFSDWVVPKTINIPVDQVETSFVRASGAGGQNVNKLSTKVELRFQVMEAFWLPLEVRQRLQAQQCNRINKDGYLVLQTQEFRTQGQNRKAALSKLQEFILQAYPRPKVRNLRTGVSRAAKKRNLEDKKRRSDRKQSRGKVDW
jgi:ribosome-associated protein